jgi:hypothetical protein
MSESYPNSTTELLEKVARIRALAESAKKTAEEIVAAVGSHVLSHGFVAEYSAALQNGGMSPSAAYGMASDMRGAFLRVHDSAMDLSGESDDIKSRTNTLEHIAQFGKGRTQGGRSTVGTAFRL